MDTPRAIPTPSDFCNSNRYLSLAAPGRRRWEDSLEQESFGKHCKQDGKPSQDGEHRQAARERVRQGERAETQLRGHPQSNAPSGCRDKGSGEQSRRRACRFPYGNGIPPAPEKGIAHVRPRQGGGPPTLTHGGRGPDPRPSLPAGWGKAFGITHVAYFSVGREGIVSLRAAPARVTHTPAKP